MPAGLFITPVLLLPSAIEERNVKLLIHNETSKDIYIPSVLANVYPTDTITTLSVDQNSTEIYPQLFEFGESSLLNTLEQRLRQKLSTRGDVFSTQEWDVGLAEGVEHRIRLQDTKCGKGGVERRNALRGEWVRRRAGNQWATE